MARVLQLLRCAPGWVPPGRDARRAPPLAVAAHGCPQAVLVEEHEVRVARARAPQQLVHARVGSGVAAQAPVPE